MFCNKRTLGNLKTSTPVENLSANTMSSITISSVLPNYEENILYNKKQTKLDSRSKLVITRI